jgi:hypothetical protein
MIVGPRHTFADLAAAVDQAFARWDLSHLHLFRLPDGRLLGEASPEWDQDVLDETSLTVASTVGVGDHFDYVFDLGDDWRHDCEVEAHRCRPDRDLRGRPAYSRTDLGLGMDPGPVRPPIV